MEPGSNTFISHLRAVCFGRPCSVFFVLLAGLVLLAGAAAQSTTSLPAESVVKEGLQITEVSATSASLRVHSELELACVLVYGKDETFGSMALDADMGGSAHSDHFVAIRGLEPDTEYVYRLQGSDLRGNFYMGRIMSFRTAAASPAASWGKNLALLSEGARVEEVSSNFSILGNRGPWGANKAIDGNANSEWSSRGDGDEAFISVALPKYVEVSGFGLWTRTMGTSAQIISFTVENTAGDVFGPFSLPDANGLYSFSVQASGQIFTFRVEDSSGGNTGVVELAVYGSE